MARVTITETDLQFNQEPGVRGSTEYLVIHHTGGVDADGNNVDTDPSAWQIHHDHQDRGYSGIGYHYVIRKNGSIERGRPREWVGAHCLPANRNSIGIHVGGNFMEEAPTIDQMTALTELCADLCEIYSLTPDAMVGHRDKDQTACPGDNLYALLPELRRQVSDLLAAG